MNIKFKIIKKLIFVFLVAILLSNTIYCQVVPSTNSKLLNYVPNEIIIKYNCADTIVTKGVTNYNTSIKNEYDFVSNAISKNQNIEILDIKPVHRWLVNEMIRQNLPERDVLNKQKSNRLRLIKNKDYNFSKEIVLKISQKNSHNIANIIDRLNRIKRIGTIEIKSASLNGISYLNYIPNDPLYNEQWAHKNCQADSGWDIQTGSSDVKIGILDSGIDLVHEDLSGNIIPGYDFVDIDTALYKMYGYNLISGEDYVIPDNNPMDFNGHGTHCAGIAGAIGNNGKGVTGVCPNCSLMPIRAGFSIGYNGSEYGSLEDDDVANALVYAANNGVDIISMSFGGRYAQVVADAIEYAASKGVLLIAAAGNENTDIISYPAGYTDVISVAATNEYDEKAYFSNYGDWVTISSPGTHILSTITKTGGFLHDTSGYKKLSGTSMATPYVAGVAGLILSEHPEYSSKEIWANLISTADNIDSLNINYKNLLGFGRVNVKRALKQTPKPNIIFSGIQIYDSIGNKNGVINPGEIISLKISLKNTWLLAENINIKLKSIDQHIKIIDSVSIIGDIGMLEIKDNILKLLKFKIDSLTPDNYQVSFILEINGNDYHKNISFTLESSIRNILNVPAEYSTIQKAINSSKSGDLVLVQPGTYNENINFKGKNIIVTSLYYTTKDKSYIESTIISGSGVVDNNYSDDYYGSLVYIGNKETSNAMLKGFTLTGGSGSYVILPGMFGPNYLGGAILCFDSYPTLSDLRIVNNSLTSSNGSGAGICLFHCTKAPTLRNITCEKNIAAGAIEIISNSRVNMNNVNVYNNIDGDGVYFNTSSGNIDTLIIDGCTGAVTTGLMGVQVDSLFMKNTEIRNNPKGTDFRACNFIDIRNTLIADNYQDGGMWAGDVNGNLVNTTFVNNTINNHYGGGAIFNTSYVDLKIVNSIFYNNRWIKLISPDTLINSISFLSDTGRFLISNTDLEKGVNGITYFNGKSNVNLNWLSGNIDTIPLFYDIVKSEFRLSQESPCIGKGTKYLKWNNIELVNLKENEYIGNVPDMGAYLKYYPFIKAVFKANKVIGGAPLSVSFNNQSYAYNTTPPDSFIWSFGDGSISNIINPTHQYAIPGDYSVFLKAINNTYSDSIRKTNYIKVLNQHLIYVSKSGSNTTGDGSVEKPYLTIQYAINLAVKGDIIIVQPGTYIENVIIDNKDITLSSMYYFSKDTSLITKTILDGAKNNSTLTLQNYLTNLTNIIGITIQNGSRLGAFINYEGGGIFCSNSNPIIDHCIIKENVANYYGGGIYLYTSNAIIKNCIIKNNTVIYNYDYSRGGGIFIGDYSEPVISNTLIMDNSAAENGGGIYAGGYKAKITIDRVTFYGNKSKNATAGGLFRDYGVNTTISNSIFWKNIPVQIAEVFIGAAVLHINYSDIQGNYSGINNINLFPEFVDTSKRNFNLKDISPCIDKGDPDSNLDPDSTIADMGALYFHHKKLKIYETTQNVNVCKGKNVELLIFADGYLPLSYKWYKNGLLLPDTTNNHSIINATTSDSGNYICVIQDIFKNRVTCNSIHVNVISLSSQTIYLSICPGDSIFLQKEYRKTAGLYIDTLANWNGCDSIVITTLTVNSTFSHTDIISMCQGEAYKGYVESGTYIENLKSILGCDSIVTTILTVNLTYRHTDTVYVCQGEAYKGHVLSGDYTDTLKTKLGCDSIILTLLTVYPVPEKPVISQLDKSTLISTASNGNQWFVESEGLINGATNQQYLPLMNGIYYVIITVNGCSSDTSNMINYIITNLKEPEINKEIIVYPIPVILNLTLESSYKIDFIKITDITGKIVIIKKIKGLHKFELNMTSCSSGYYNLYIYLKGFEFPIIRKLIKQ